MFDPKNVLYEDNHLLAVVKMPGQICQGDKTGDEPLPELIKNWIKVRDNKPGAVFLGVVHRLDRPVSGVILFAKTSKALARLNSSLSNREMAKTYLALVPNLPEPTQGVLEHHLLKDQQRNKSYVVAAGTKESKRAVLHYQTLASFDRYHLLEIILETGRHHQIRAQLSAIGCPIKGDLKYGSKRSNPDASISLHAYRLSFSHPVKDESVQLIAPPPPGDPLWQQARQFLAKPQHPKRPKRP